MTQQTNDATPAQTSPSSEGASAALPNSGQPPAGEGAAAAAASPSTEATARPEGLPDRFWDAGSGVKLPELVRHLGELEAFKAGEDARRGAVPEKPEAYELKLPEDIKFPDGTGFELDADDPMVALGRQVAHQAGLDQAGFEKVVGLYAQHQVAIGQELARIEAANMDLLGPKASDRVNAVRTFIASRAGPDLEGIFAASLKTQAGIEAWEKIIRSGSSGGLPNFSQTGREGGPELTREQRFYPTMAKQQGA